MAQPWQQRRRRRLLAALLVLLSLCCLGSAASAASAAVAGSTHRKDGAAVATEKAAGPGQEAARGFSATSTAEGELPTRMEMEVDVQDYPPTNANARHEPGFPRPRGPEHP